MPTYQSNRNVRLCHKQWKLGGKLTLDTADPAHGSKKHQVFRTRRDLLASALVEKMVERSLKAWLSYFNDTINPKRHLMKLDTNGTMKFAKLWTSSRLSLTQFVVSSASCVTPTVGAQ